VLAQLSALQRLSVNQLKVKWEDLFATAAPNNSRGFLEVRIAGRIQELTYGGLTRDTRRTLDNLADEVEGKITRKGMADDARLRAMLSHHEDLFASLTVSEGRSDLAVVAEDADLESLGLSGYARDAADELVALAAGDDPRAAAAQDALRLLYRLTSTS
jgi:hypothetical protein